MPRIEFSREPKREKTRAMRRDHKPYMLSGSLMCAASSTWRRLGAKRNKDAAAMRRAKVEALLHMDFVISLYVGHVQAGRFYLYAHPQHASSCKLPSMEELMGTHGIYLAHADQCQYGAVVAHGPLGGSPIKKPTGSLSNARKV